MVSPEKQNQWCRAPIALQSGGQLRYGPEQIGLEAVVGDAEDRRLSSLLIATMTFESFMPARWWIAPADADGHV
jgi:hypothetical protein